MSTWTFCLIAFSVSWTLNVNRFSSGRWLIHRQCEPHHLRVACILRNDEIYRFTSFTKLPFDQKATSSQYNGTFCRSIVWLCNAQEAPSRFSALSLLISGAYSLLDFHVVRLTSAASVKVSGDSLNCQQCWLSPDVSIAERHFDLACCRRLRIDGLWTGGNQRWV